MLTCLVIAEIVSMVGAAVIAAGLENSPIRGKEK